MMIQQECLPVRPVSAAAPRYLRTARARHRSTVAPSPRRMRRPPVWSPPRWLRSNQGSRDRWNAKRRRASVLLRPHSGGLEPDVTRYVASSLQLFRLIGGFEGTGVDGVVVDDRDLLF